MYAKLLLKEIKEKTKRDPHRVRSQQLHAKYLAVSIISSTFHLESSKTFLVKIHPYVNP